MNIYVKVPVDLLDEGAINVYHYCQLYSQLLTCRKINLKKYAQQNNLSYTTARRLLSIAKQQSQRSNK